MLYPECPPRAMAGSKVNAGKGLSCARGGTRSSEKKKAQTLPRALALTVDEDQNPRGFFSPAVFSKKKRGKQVFVRTTELEMERVRSAGSGSLAVRPTLFRAVRMNSQGSPCCERLLDRSCRCSDGRSECEFVTMEGCSRTSRTALRALARLRQRPTTGRDLHFRWCLSRATFGESFELSIVQIRLETTFDTSQE